jgi:hypothetical protein
VVVEVGAEEAVAVMQDVIIMLAEDIIEAETPEITKAVVMGVEKVVEEVAIITPVTMPKRTGPP